MVYFPLVFLCVYGLFVSLLRDRYRIWTTLAVMTGAYLLSLFLSSLLKDKAPGPFSAWQLPCAGGIAMFLAASFFLHSNNLLQKFFVAVLSLANFAYCLLFIPLFLGAMPFSTAGAMGGALSILATLLVYLVTGLCLYRPLQRFSDRGPSVFLAGMLILMGFHYLLCLGKLDALFGVRTPTRRLLLATGFYCILIFCFRSVYQAGRWQARAARDDLHNRLLEMESGDFVDMLAAVREVRAAQKAGEYALDTVLELMRDEQPEKVPVYINMVKRNTQHNPILAHYHDNPYLNGVIATKAAFAAQNDIEFECNALHAEGPIKTADLCILVNEMLTRACFDSAAFEGQRRLRFTAIPAEDSLRLEAVYSGLLPEKPRFSLAGKKLGDLFAWLFDDTPQEESELRGLDCTAEIVLSHSGSLTVSGTGTEVIIRAMLRF